MSYRAALVRELGGPENLRIEQVERIALGANDVRVAIEACGVNFPDLLMVAGRYQLKPPLPFTPGTESSGTIIEVGSAVPSTRVDERVITRHRLGGYADEVVLNADATLPLPDGFSFAEGATYYTAHMTSWHALVTRGQVQRGEMLLVLGAGGGVGLAAVDIGAHLGAHIIATGSSPEKRAAAKSAGAHELIDSSTEDVLARVRELTDGRGVDVIYDPVGLDGETLTRLCAFGARILIVGFAGNHIPNFAANRVLLKGASVVGVRAGEFGRNNSASRAQEMVELNRLASEGKLRPKVTATFPLAQAHRALEELRDRRAFGRLALTRV